MHKQLLSTAFAAFLALAFVFGIISPMAESTQKDQTSEEITTEEYADEPSAAPQETEKPEIEETTAPPETSDAETTAPSEPEESTKEEEKEKDELLLPILPEGAVPLSLYINGRAIEDGFCFEHKGKIWLPVEGFGGLFDYDLLAAEEGKSYIVSGERAIPCSKRDSEVTVIECGVLCAPIEPLLSAAGLNATEIIGNEICIWGVPTFPEAEDIYDDEDLYWLSRIISAESRGEPFIGQLAVGTVVINRTRSDYYPDTIYEVIFDRLGGVQFTPASTGSVYRDPTESSILAAKLCLEGFSLDDGILFFFNSRIAAGSWITANRTYTMTVGQHDFYS